MELIEAINLRHSTRAYLEDTPSRETIENLMAAATRAPCAFNRQALRFTVILNRAFLNEISAGAKNYMTRTDRSICPRPCIKNSPTRISIFFIARRR